VGGSRSRSRPGTASAADPALIPGAAGKALPGCALSSFCCCPCPCHCLAVLQELATLHTLLLYTVPFKEQYGRILLSFYPSLGGALQLPAYCCGGVSRGPFPPAFCHQAECGKLSCRPIAASPLACLACSAGQAACGDSGAGPADGAGVPPGGTVLYCCSTSINGVACCSACIV
jgi:hypothetical protein